MTAMKTRAPSNAQPSDPQTLTLDLSELASPDLLAFITALTDLVNDQTTEAGSDTLMFVLNKAERSISVSLPSLL